MNVLMCETVNGNFLICRRDCYGITMFRPSSIIPY